MNSDTTKQHWRCVCAASEVPAVIGVRALLGTAQIALFRVADRVYAIDAIDPFSNAAVLSRGLVGDINGELVVASPIYKHHFSLVSGVCLEDSSVRIATYPVREVDGQLEILCASVEIAAEPELTVC